MTCIVGVVSRESVYVGGDSAGVGGWDLTVRRDAKVFRNGPFLMGFTTSFRMGQLLRYGLNVRGSERYDPHQPALGECGPGVDPFRYMVTEFVDAVRTLLKAGGFAVKDKEQESGGTFLVGFRNRLFRVDSDFQVGESADGIDAVGAGAAVALGSLHTSGKMMPEIAAERRVTLALEAAERLNGAVRGPFVIESQSIAYT